MATIAIGISKKPGGSFTADVPVNSLAEDGVPPEEGDSVQFSCEGKVQSVQGSNATISIDSINGEPVSEEAGESPQEEGSEEGQQGAGGAGGGGAGGAGGPPTPVAASGPSDRIPGTPMGMSTGMGIPPARAKNMANVAAMGQKLRKAAKGKPFPPF